MVWPAGPDTRQALVEGRQRRDRPEERVMEDGDGIKGREGTGRRWGAVERCGKCWQR